MVFARSSALRASSVTRVVRSARSIRSAELQPWQQMMQRRTYASSHSTHEKSSEIPWMMASVSGTALGLYFILNQDTSHGEGHGDHHEEKAVSPVIKEEMAAKAAELKEAALGKKALEQDHEEDVKAVKPAEEEEKKEEPKENKLEETEKRNKEEPHQGEKPSSTDKPDPRGEAKSQNEMSGKQQGLSNDDTRSKRHVGEEPQQSKKGEGVADSAKLKGTVSPERPAAENKEERGKTEQDKNA